MSVPLQKLLSQVKHEIELKGGNPFNEQELRAEEDANKKDASTTLLNRLKGAVGGGKETKTPRFIKFTTRQFNKLDEGTQTELSSLTKSSIISKSLLSFVVAYRIHCYKNLVKHEQMMTKPELDLVISQFAKIYNNPDTLSALALCWPLGDNSKIADPESKIERMRSLIMRLYPSLFDPNLHFDAIYPTRSTPLH